MKSDLIFSDDQSHFTNAGEEIMALGEVAWSDVFYLIDDAENSYRNALFQIMSEPAKNAHTNPLNSARKKPSSERNLSEPLFKSCSQNGPSTKFHYVRRLTLTRAWFFENGFVTPFVDRPISQYKRFPKTFPVAETIIGLADDDLSSLLQHCIVDPETRESLSDGFWESSIEADFARVRTRLGELSAQGNSPEVSLNVLFNEALAPTWERKTYDPFRRATFHYLFSASAAGKILLPAQVIARHRSDFSFIYTSVLRGPLLQLLCKGRFDEVVHATQFEPNSGNSHRNISTADLVCMFCCSNYGLTAGFQPEAIYLVRQTLSNEKHNLRPYFFGAADFYEADIRDIRLWANRLKSRRSEELSDDPLALFRADTAQVRRTMPLQVEHFEEKTATRYPSAISTEIRDWAYDLESLLDRTPRKSRASMYRSVGHWLMYLYTLDDVPGSFADLRVGPLQGRGAVCDSGK